jgi:hypothetical protein
MPFFYDARFERNKAVYISVVYVSWTPLCLIFETQKINNCLGVVIPRGTFVVPIIFPLMHHLREMGWDIQTDVWLFYKVLS